MLSLPVTAAAPVLRTGFGDDAGWATIQAAMVRETAEGFQANVEFIDNPEFADVHVDALLERLPPDYPHSFLVVVDGLALKTPSHDVLVVNLYDPAHARFRAEPVQIQAIENNLSIDNMDFEEFAGAVGSDGVFRGFGPPQPEPTAASPVHRTWDPIRDAMLFHPDEILRRPRLAHVLRSPRRELGIALSDPDLLEALYDSPPAVRDCAVRAAVRRLAERAGIAELPWVVPALEAVAGGLPLPAPFDDYARLVSMIDTDPAFAVPATEIAMVGGGNQTVRPSRIAVAAILGVHGLPSEDAALRLVSQVLYGSGVPHHRAAINELRTDLGLPARTQWPGGPAGFITELE